MFGSKSRAIRALQYRLGDAEDALAKARKDAGTWEFNCKRAMRRAEGLEAQVAAQESLLAGFREARRRQRATPTKLTAHFDISGANVRSPGQPVDLAAELARAQAHAGALEQRLAGLQEANERMFWGLARRAGTEPSQPAADEFAAGAT